jgi:hypothetical protein
MALHDFGWECVVKAMTTGKATTAGLFALLLSGIAASAAYAQEVKAEPGVTLTDRNLWGPQQTHKSFQWDAGKSRWGLKFDVEQSPTRNGAWQDVEAGAYFKVTPSLSIGGGVAVRDQALTANPNQSNPQGPPGVPTNVPRVRLETAFKF